MKLLIRRRVVRIVEQKPQKVRMDRLNCEGANTSADNKISRIDICARIVFSDWHTTGQTGLLLAFEHL